MALIPPPYRTDEDAIHCEINIGDAFDSQSENEWADWIEKFGQEMAGVLTA